jgi:hypothetical protein
MTTRDADECAPLCAGRWSLPDGGSSGGRDPQHNISALISRAARVELNVNSMQVDSSYPGIITEPGSTGMTNPGSRSGQVLAPLVVNNRRNVPYMEVPYMEGHVPEPTAPPLL